MWAGPGHRAEIEKWQKYYSLNLFFTKAGAPIIETSVVLILFTIFQIFTKSGFAKQGGLLYLIQRRLNCPQNLNEASSPHLLVLNCAHS